MAGINSLKATRLEKLDALREKRIETYPGSNGRTHTVAQARGAGEGDVVTVAGRVMSRRGHGKIAFFDLVDSTGKIQAVAKADQVKPDTFSLLEYQDTGDFWQVTGTIGKTQAGEVSVFATDLTILSKSLRPLPDQWYGFDDVEERYRQRYVDLIMNANVKNVFLTRTRVVKFIRDYLDRDGFVEVETPVLQPIYGGASAKPFVTHHNALDVSLYLRIAVELYLKRLVVGGFDKVYEIGKDFRNEGIDRQHNPEFTMVEFYWAYADYRKLMEYTEQMLSSLVSEIKGSLTVGYQGKTLDFTPPWPRLRYRDVVLEYTGIDIDAADTQEKLTAAITEKGLKLDMSGLVGYGAILDELYKTYARPHLLGPLFLIDRPTAFVSLAKRLPEDDRYTASFQLLVDGKEVLNAYNELNDPIDQAARWRDSEALAKRGQVEYEAFDDDYIRALEYGMPPTAGWGMGIDRLVTILTDSPSLKDVILFPTMRPDHAPAADQPKAAPVPAAPAPISQSAAPVQPASAGNGTPISRQKAMAIMTELTANKNLVKHMLAVEAIMRALARRFGADEDLWGVAGLLHDADYDMFKDDPKKHPSKILDILAENGDDGRLAAAVRAHAWGWREDLPEPSNDMEWAIYTCDELSGLITACALVRPDKSLASLDVASIMKKWKVPSFAAGAKRENIAYCEPKLGIPVEEFVGIALKAMQDIHEDLGL